jgi:hypothetical protein
VANFRHEQSATPLTTSPLAPEEALLAGASSFHSHPASLIRAPVRLWYEVNALLTAYLWYEVKALLTTYLWYEVNALLTTYLWRK